MTREEKLEAIEDMGINVMGKCPSDYGLTDYCATSKGCGNCFIKALEANPNDKA